MTPLNKRERQHQHLKSEKKHKSTVEHSNQKPYDDFVIEVDAFELDGLPTAR